MANYPQHQSTGLIERRFETFWRFLFEGEDQWTNSLEKNQNETWFTRLFWRDTSWLQHEPEPESFWFWSTFGFFLWVHFGIFISRSIQPNEQLSLSRSFIFSVTFFLFSSRALLFKFLLPHGLLFSLKIMKASNKSHSKHKGSHEEKKKEREDKAIGQVIDPTLEIYKRVLDEDIENKRKLIVILEQA